ncbi:MAG: 4Fe-4S binding protein [Candidatus Nitricoxidivorans perseverans]|uniref:4Fe-4S binding protein n=1 Tax=Candidatus Nitricoxidivorans perseverans TaxID=2975601 RepID=A0AA49FKZ6_9PROT|nr:MAG: 4Fe-4S binding protein [Candidatus Nitricoxidivorans perseverans]
MPPSAASGDAIQRLRLAFQAAFFVLFVVAPVFDLFRYDLTRGHAVFLGFEWRLGIDEFLTGRIGAAQAGIDILLRLFLPIFAVAALFLAVAWRWGRLYCGWLCPHFSVVETLNRLMRRASGKPSLWERKPLPPRNPDGGVFKVDARWWLAVVPLAVAFAFVWAVALLTYLLPPVEVYGNLFSLSLTRNQALFIGVGTLVFTLEFLFARHLFCRFGCAVGLFQSLAWMANRGAMVVGFERARAADCADCYAADGPGFAACEGVCPMRLRPRVVKHKMFTCTQCGQCIAACGTVERNRPEGTLLRWVDKDAARRNEAQVSLTGRRDEEI